MEKQNQPMRDMPNKGGQQSQSGQQAKGGQHSQSMPGKSGQQSRSGKH